jgi:8-oxo-dGTP pyrophosphatase MutT (NUDIX family)
LINQKLKEAISGRQKIYLHDEKRIPSAVLIPIFYQHEEYYILFTRRTELVHHHKGEISFPGGGYHAADGNLVTTALRESYEEIGLKPGDVEILGELDDSFTKGSPYIVTPFLGFIKPDYIFTPSDFEIAEIMKVPIKALLKEGCRHEEPEIELGGRRIVPYFYAIEGKCIIGATARILKQFLDIFSLVSGLKPE